MAARFQAILEHGDGVDARLTDGQALARVVQLHPALEPLLDFVAADPKEIAQAVGMVHFSEEDGADDLDDIDFGPSEWFEPGAGLAAVQSALRAVGADPQSIARAIYDPGLRPAEVIADLTALEETLLLARQRETRFHFLLRE